MKRSPEINIGVKLWAMVRKRSVADRSGFTVLVVDDQEETLISTELLLKREGHKVLLAQTGDEALAIHRREMIDLMLVDYFMPRMTGEDLVRAIRERDEYIQIILLTGYSGERPPRAMLKLLDIQGYHDKSDGPDRLLLWVDVALKAASQLRHIRKHERELLESRTELRRLSDHLFTVQEEERERISRELHDQLGQLLTAIGLDIDWVVSRALTDESKARLTEAADLVRQAIKETRQLCASLRSGAIDGEGLIEAIHAYAVDFARRSGLELNFSNDLPERLGLATEPSRNIYRIMQEALSNVARHAAAQHIKIAFSRTAHGFAMSVTDDGRGFDPPAVSDPHAVGLVGMRERALFIGARLTIQSHVGSGTSIQLEVPFTVS